MNIKKNKFKHKSVNKKMTNLDNDAENAGENGDTVKTMDDAKAMVVEQEIKFARCLAGNDPKVRNRVLKNLRKWLRLRSQGSFPFTDTDFLRLWKGLWYCMWMSDKPLVQEKLAEDLSELVHCFDDPKVSIQFFGNFLATMCREWFGIDQWRMDKFMMLVRRMFRQLLFKLQASEWDADVLQLYAEWLDKTIYNESKAPIGLTMHFNDLYLEEISKVTDGAIDPSDFHALLEPCIVFFAKSTDLRHIKHAKRNIFHKLLFQSELGQDYQEKFDIWKKASFPCSSIHDLEVNIEVEDASDQENNESDSESTVNEKEFDARAGRVDVVLKEIKFDANEVINLFEKYRFKEFTNAKSRKNIKELIQKFRKFANGEFPLGIQTMPTVEDVKSKFEPFDADKKAQELMEYEEELIKNTVYVPPRLKRKLEWKQKRILNGDSNGWTEENDENNENEMPPKKKKQKKNKVEEPTPVKKSKKQKTDDDAQENAKNLMKEWIKKGKEVEKEETPKKITPKSKKSDKKLDQLSQPEFSTPKSQALVLNPFAAATASKKQQKDKLKGKSGRKLSLQPPVTSPTDSDSNNEKRVKIALNKNMVQEKHEYIQAVKNSPVPYDSSKKPKKGLLKPNLLPSPINPFYKKRIGLKFNDTL